MTLTQRQIEQQEFVDDAIYELLNNLAGKELEWDSELIGSVRDVIAQEFEQREIMAAKELYPWIGCDNDQ
jgi:hypothetical protein